MGIKRLKPPALRRGAPPGILRFPLARPTGSWRRRLTARRSSK